MIFFLFCSIPGGQYCYRVKMSCTWVSNSHAEITGHSAFHACLGKCHLLPQEGLLEFGEEHKILGDEKGEHKKIFLSKGEQKIFIKKDFLDFVLRLC